MNHQANQAIESLQKAVRLASENGVDGSSYQGQTDSFREQLNRLAQSVENGDYFGLAAAISNAEDLAIEANELKTSILTSGIKYVQGKINTLQDEVATLKRTESDEISRIRSKNDDEKPIELAGRIGGVVGLLVFWCLACLLPGNGPALAFVAGPIGGFLVKAGVESVTRETRKAAVAQRTSRVYQQNESQHKSHAAEIARLESNIKTLEDAMG